MIAGKCLSDCHNKQESERDNLSGTSTLYLVLLCVFVGVKIWVVHFQC